MNETAPMQSTPLPTRIEAVLFVEGTTVRIDKLARLLHASREEVLTALEELAEGYRNEQRALQLVQNEDAVAIALEQRVSDELSALQRQAAERDIGPAGLEVLAILLYKGPATRARIDYIRGVNSSSTVRNLLARGLLERTKSHENTREVLYKPTVELLGHLGISTARELPEYAQIREALEEFQTRLDTQEQSRDHATTS